MFRAVNKNTNEIVTAWEIFKNPSYLLPENDNWTCDPYTDCIDWDLIKQKPTEIKVTYVKEHFRKGDRWVSPHFRIPKATELGINVNPESIYHKKAKDIIFTQIKNETKLKFYISKFGKQKEIINPIFISDLKIDFNKANLETPMTENNNKQIVDVFLPFKEKHYLLGDGIVIEIQFSNQTDKTTKKRSYGFALKNFSVCWLYKKDFDDSDLINKELEIFSSKSMIKELEDNYVSNIQDLSRKLDRKINYTKQEVKFYIEEEIKHIETIIRNKAKHIVKSDFYGELETTRLSLKKELEVPEENVKQFVTDVINEKINIDYVNERILKIVNEQISKEFTPEKINDILKSKFEINTNLIIDHLKLTINKKAKNIIEEYYKKTEEKIKEELKSDNITKKIKNMFSEEGRKVILNLKLYGEICPHCKNGRIIIKEGGLMKCSTCNFKQNIY